MSTKFAELINGAGEKVEIHITMDEPNERYKFYRTRTGLENDRKIYGNSMKYKANYPVPSDSEAAKQALINWLEL